MLKLSDLECKITLNNMLRGLVEKVGNRQEQMGKISREMNTLRKNEKNAKIEKCNGNEGCL